MKLTFKDHYDEQESKLVISQIDFEIENKRKNLDVPGKNKKNIGPIYIEARIQDLENWRDHYLENTFVR